MFTHSFSLSYDLWFFNKLSAKVVSCLPQQQASRGKEPNDGHCSKECTLSCRSCFFALRKLDKEPTTTTLTKGGKRK